MTEIRNSKWYELGVGILNLGIKQKDVLVISFLNLEFV
jgi:hypothetical protein